MQHYAPARLTSAAEAGRRARRLRVRGDRLGRGARHRQRVARPDPRRRSAQARLLHRPRPEPGADRLVGEPVRHPELRRAWRLLLGQHGGGRHLHDRRLVLGVRRAGLGAHPLFHAVRLRRGPRQQPDQDRARQAQGSAASRSSRSTRCAPATRRSPTSGSAITPGTDGLFVLALVHELLRAGQVDVDYLARYTNAPLAGGRRTGPRRRRPVPARRRRPAAVLGPRGGRRCARPTIRRQTEPQGRGALPDGPARRAGVPPAGRALSRSDATARTRSAPQTGIPAATIRRIAAELAHAAFARRSPSTCPGPTLWGRRHEHMVGRPVSMHAMRGISAHANGFHTCRALHLLQTLLGTIDAPGGFRYKPPFPKPIAAGPQARRASRRGRARPAAARAAARLSGRARGPAGRGRRQPVPDRQGVLLGGAARRPWPDAPGDHQRRTAAIPTRSTRCSCTWPTWPGTRP